MVTFCNSNYSCVDKGDFQHNTGPLLNLVATLNEGYHSQCVYIIGMFVGLQVQLFNDIYIYKMSKCNINGEHALV